MKAKRVESLEQRWLMAAYVPLAPTSSPSWLTGYFTQSGTVDLQAAAALAPDVAGGEAAGLPRDIRVNAAGLPLLESRPSGTGLELFVDFPRDDPGGNGPFSLDADTTTFNFAEQMAIYNCWRNLAGIFSAFNVNVTTVAPPTGAADPLFAWIQVSNDFSGGAAYVDSLTKSVPTGWVNSDNATGRVSGIAHEFGHILSLPHQANFDKYGSTTAEYSNGDGNRNVPIMGVDYNGVPTSRWWLGRVSDGSSGATIVDDVQKIASKISSIVGGDGFRPDDFGNTIAAAFNVAAGAQQFDGYLERYSDADYFKITAAAAGNWNFTATPLYGSHAQPKLELLDSSGSVIVARDDATQRNGQTNEQFLNVNLATGTYYVRVSSSGDYSELGYYRFAAAPLPSFFSSDDVGTPDFNGTVSYDPTNGTFTQSAGGEDLLNTNDHFHFTYETLTGDGSITARVDSLDNINASTTAGVMIRQSLNSNSAFAYAGITPSGNFDGRRRSSTGASSAVVSSAGAGPWVRITRAGNVFTYASSSDGSAWTTRGTATITMTGPVYIGLATCAWSDNDEAFATYSNVSVTGNVTPTAPTYNALPAPATLAAAPAAGANTSIDLAWGAVAGAAGYRIERSVDGIHFSTLTNVGAAVTTYTDVNVWGSMRWFYRVSASNGTAVFSAPSPIANTVNKPNAPGTPSYTAPVIARGTTELDFNWLDVQGETGYRLERSTDGVNYTLVSNLAANRTSQNVTGLTAGTAYTFRVTPLTSVGDGAAPPLLFNTQTRMAAVTNLRFTAKNPTSMTIAWNDPALDSNTHIERSTDGTTWTSVGDAGTNAATWTDNNVSPGGEYYYRVTPFTSAFDGIASGVIFAAAPAASLPAGWLDADVGTVAGTGAATFTNGTWQVVSGGSDYVGTTDHLNFAYRAISNNVTLVARVNTIEQTGAGAMAGLMIRQDLTTGSKYAAISLSANGTTGIDFRSRATASGSAAIQSVLPNVTAPYWLRLARNGNTISTAYSTDGVTFTPATSVTLAFSGTFYVGMAVVSDSTTTLNTTTFSNFTIGQAAPTIATPAAATPAPVTGTTTSLSVLGADDTGEPSLIYTWSATGPAPVIFSVNGTNAAKNSVATFSKAGDYTFTVTVTDPDNRTATSSVSVTVNQTFSGVSATSSILAGFSQQMTTVDQFGQAITVADVTWSASIGSITSSGIYTAPEDGSTSVLITGTVDGVEKSTTESIVLPLAWYKNDTIDGPSLADASGNGHDGTLFDGSGSYGSTAGKFGNALLLSNANAASTNGAHASLPPGIVSSLTDFTISSWVKPTSLSTWARLFDFGSGTGSYMFLSIANSSGAPRFAIKASGGSEQLINGTAAIPIDAWTHLVVTLSGTTATLYVNGVVAGTNANVTVTPGNLGNTTQNYLGESQYTSDPTFKGAIDDFRIYGSAASAEAIAALYAAVSIAPTVQIQPVSPDPSDAPVDSIDFVFSEPVTGFDLADLTLTRDGGATLLPGNASLATSDSITWTLSGLSDLTSSAGAYVVTLVAAGSGVIDLESNPLAADSSESFVVQSRVVGRHLFYNNSSFDQSDPTSTPDDDLALASDKSALLPGETASFSNYTSYSRGINGVMLDIQGLSVVPSESDFTFHVGNDNDPSGWVAAPLPASITVRAGAGRDGSSRVTLVWSDGEIKNQWLQVTASTSLGLPQADVFYFGNAIGETGDNAADARVNASDEIAVRSNPKTFLDPAPVDFRYDFNRDGFVNATDQILARSNSTTLLTALQMITASAESGPLQSVASGAGAIMAAELISAEFLTGVAADSAQVSLDATIALIADSVAEYVNKRLGHAQHHVIDSTRASRSAGLAIHNRMPVLLDEHDYAAWLNPTNQDGESPRYLLDPLQTDRIKVRPVRTHVNNAPRPVGPE